ncbi:MAG: hypothetical protein AAF417_02365 [Pseudomonadota bacterium]
MTQFSKIVATSLVLSGMLGSTALAADDALVIGKLRIVKNGAEVTLNRGVFGNQASLRLVQLDTQERLDRKVGRDGEIAWDVEPGQYRLEGIDFMVRGERVRAQSNFVLTVTADTAATYVGTVTLEATFDGGHSGLAGSIDRYSVTDECSQDCSVILSRVGLADESLTVALMRPNLQLFTSQ